MTDKAVKVGRFTYMHSPLHYGDDRWIAHDENEFCAGEFTSEADAVAACERWTAADAHLLTVDWKSPGEDAPDSDRGTYIVRIAGCNGQRTFCSGWHTMEAQIRFSQKFRDLIAEYGIDASRAFWKACQ